MEKLMKRNVKDSVFTHLFGIPKYRKELYVSLHPEDADIDENDIESITLSNILASGLHNDLGIFVKQKIIILIEAQSTWTENILWRMFYYLAESYRRKWTEDKLNIYGSKKVYLPEPELYVVYTGDKLLNKEIISIQEEFFENKDVDIDLKMRIIVSKNTNRKISVNSNKNASKNFLPNTIKNDIMNQYIEFVKIYDKNRMKNQNKKECIVQTIDECIEKNILAEYLTKYRTEVEDMIDVEAEQAFATECFGREKYAEGRAEGKAEGRVEGKAEGETLAFIKLYKKNLIKSKDAAKMLNISEEEFLEKVKL